MKLSKYIKLEVPFHITTTALLVLFLAAVLVIPLVIIAGTWLLLSFTLSWPVYRLFKRKIKLFNFKSLIKVKEQLKDTEK